MTRRKSIARRRPVIIYRIDYEGQAITVKAWRGDEDMGRIDGPKVFENSWPITGDAAGGSWIDSRDTDAIHNLPAAVRDLVWGIDDELRKQPWL